MAEQNPLARIGFISINETTQRNIGDFVLDPSILLPVEMPPGSEGWNTASLSWEAIISGMLKVLAYEPTHKHADYYRRFVLAVKPDIKAELSALGAQLAKDKKFDSALEIFTALVGLFPDCAQCRMNLALVCDERARHYDQLEKLELAEQYRERAFDSYKRALELDPEEPEIHYNLAHFYLSQRTFDKAKHHFQLFLKRATDPKRIPVVRRIVAEIEHQGYMDLLFKEAFDFIKMGKEQEGIDRIKKFIEKYPTVWNAWFLLGWGYRRLKRYAEGKEAFLKALEYDATHPDTFNELAICLMELGELEESHRRLEEALALEPENTKVIANLGVLALKRGDTEEALGFFRTVREIDPEDPIAIHFLDLLAANQ